MAESSFHCEPLRRLLGSAIACSLLLTLCGCQRSFYAAKGTVASHGGPLGQWSLRPDGCSLAPFDDLPVGASRSIVEFVWERGRPSVWTGPLIENRWPQGPDVLDISRASSGINASFKFIQTGDSIELNAADCAVLRLDQHPGPPVLPGAPASLAGRLVMDCTVNGSHLTANVVFRGCVL